ncbi:hypothetical protein [Streptomyces flavofungini]|uniref:hypothetical protein n=1 Tax=Streptomyces flavofungini TaxID=68200 RepID=UPI001E284807|nr:hypothetical protein [Streptomyces flavofungini]
MNVPDSECAACAAARALRRAADLAPRREDSARLLVEAAAEAVFTGDIAWVEELTAAARPRTDDPSLLTAAAVQAGRLAVLTVRHTAVFSRLADAAEQLIPTRPSAALDLLSGAAVVRFYSGQDTQRHRIQSILRRLPEDAAPTGVRTWVRAVTDPFADRGELVALLPRLTAEARTRPELLTTVGIMAWLLDETPGAVRAFDEAFDRWETQGALPEGLGGAVAWASVERGRWEQAREACARTTALGRATGLDHAVACAAAVDATVLAFQGDVTAARTRVDEALTLIDPLESRSVHVYARRALGAVAAAEGAYEAAYDQLRRVFTDVGAPVHCHASYPAVADLAAAAVRCDRREEAVLIVERSARALGDNASPRLRALISRARGLLAAPKDAETPGAPRPPGAPSCTSGRPSRTSYWSTGPSNAPRPCSTSPNGCGADGASRRRGRRSPRPWRSSAAWARTRGSSAPGPKRAPPASTSRTRPPTRSPNSPRSSGRSSPSPPAA